MARLLTALCGCAFSGYPFAELTPQASARFHRYIELVEATMTRNAAFEKDKLRDGEVRILPCDPPEEIQVRGGMIQDWRGAMFIPHATIERVKAVLQDYDNYSQFYKPEVIESKLIAHQGD